MHRRTCDHASSHLWPCIVALVAVHRRTRRHASSQPWPCIVTALAKHRHGSGRASSRVRRCIATAATPHRHGVLRRHDNAQSERRKKYPSCAPKQINTEKVLSKEEKVVPLWPNSRIMATFSNTDLLNLPQLRLTTSEVRKVCSCYSA